MKATATMLGVLVAICLTACASTKKAAPSLLPVKDSTNVEVRYKLIERIDTVFANLPPQTAERTTNDTTSTLENDYAKSTASILPNGLLYHNLETKPQPIPVHVKNTSEERDSVRTRVIEVPVPYPVEVEVNRLTWWQKTRLNTWGWLVIALALCVGWMSRKPLFTLARRLLTKAI